jgi:hypothetical protein
VSARKRHEARRRELQLPFQVCEEPDRGDSPLIRWVMGALATKT